MADHRDYSLTQLQRQGKITRRMLERQLIKRFGKRAGQAELKRLLNPGK